MPIRIPATGADVEIAQAIARRTTPDIERVSEVLTWGQTKLEAK